MALLGLNYPIIYQAKNLQSGLADIVVKIIKPDNSIVGTFPMIEMVAQVMNGVYKYDLNTLTNDLKGEWIAQVVSPTENHKVVLKIDFDVPNISGGVVDTARKIPKILVRSSKMQFLIKSFKVNHVVKSNKLITSIKKNDKITKFIKNDKITGVVKCKNF